MPNYSDEQIAITMFEDPVIIGRDELHSYLLEQAYADSHKSSEQFCNADEVNCTQFGIWVFLKLKA